VEASKTQTLDKAREILFHLFTDDRVRDAIVLLIEDKLVTLRGRLSSRTGGNDFHTRATALIEANGGVMALEEVQTMFLMLRQELLETESPSDEQEQG
jgi:hypothetical protein